MQLQLASPQFPRFAFDLNVQRGKDVNFVEPDRSAFLLFNSSADFRPTGKVRATTSYYLVWRNRESDGTRLSTQHIPRVKLEYQLSRPIFFRFVGQYGVDERAALRDPATGFPLLQRNGQGAYVATTARSVNDLQMDWLFSYRPTPGTVLFFGYGSNLTEADAFQFRDMIRVRDGFFIKLSYPFRVQLRGPDSSIGAWPEALTVEPPRSDGSRGWVTCLARGSRRSPTRCRRSG